MSSGQTLGYSEGSLRPTPVAQTGEPAGVVTAGPGCCAAGRPWAPTCCSHDPRETQGSPSPSSPQKAGAPGLL